MNINQAPKGLWVSTGDGRPLFFYSTDARFRAHIHPLFAPGTDRPMTRFRPADHPWQYGVFTGLNKVNGFDFWCCGDAYYTAEIRGAMRHREIVELTHAADGGVAFTAINDWLGPAGEPVLEERQAITVPDQAAEEELVFDFEWTLAALHGDVHIAQSDYGGLSARLMGLDSTRRHLSSEGRADAACADQPARWVSVAQPVDGVGIYTSETSATYAYAGLAIFDHPENLHYPNRWRVDHQGMINPAIALTAAIDIPRGESLTLRYRIFAFLGVGDAARIETAWQSWTGQSK